MAARSLTIALALVAQAHAKRAKQIELVAETSTFNNNYAIVAILLLLPAMFLLFAKLKSAPQEVRVPPATVTLFEDYSTVVKEDPPAKDAYKAESMYWFALNHSMTVGFGLPTLICFAVLVVQLLVLNGLLFQNSVNVPPAKLAKTWEELLALEVSFEEKAGLGAALVTVPILLVASLAAHGEFYDMAVFATTLIWYSRQSWATDSPRERLTLIFWIMIHVLKCFFLVPIFIFVNAQFLANEHDMRLLFTKTMVTAFLLDLDDLIYKAFYKNDPDAAKLSTRQIGVKTQALCASVRQYTITLLGVAQLSMCFFLKQYRSLSTMWLIPLLGFGIFLTYLTAIPTDINKRSHFRLPPWLIFSVFYSIWLSVWLYYMSKPLGLA